MRQILSVILLLAFAIKTLQMTYGKIINNHLRSSENEQNFHEELLRKLYQQHIYEAILVLNQNGQHQYCHNFVKYLKFLEIPTTVMTGNHTYSYRNRFNNRILSIVCMPSYNYNVLQQLADILNYMRYTRSIIVVDQQTKQLNVDELREFFQYCHKLKMLNVAVIFEDFYKTCSYVQYTTFPEFSVEFGVYNPDSSDFLMLPNRLQDLKGYKLRTIADHTEPRAMEYYNEYNESVLNGYIGRFVRTVAEALNATLYHPVKVPHDMMLDYRDIMGYVINYSLDIPVSSLSLYEFDDQRDFSYPFEMGKWCILLPMEKPLEFKELFLKVLHSQIMTITIVLIALFTIIFYLALCKKYSHQWRYRWPEIVVNDVVIRGVLGQGFIFTAYNKLSLKLIYVMLLLTGLTISTVFNSNCLSLTTQPPLEPEINTFPELGKSSLKLAIARQEIEYLHNITNGSLDYLQPKFHTFSTFGEYTRFRDTLDRRFAYPTTSSKLYYYNGLENHYNMKIFRFSSKMCPNTMMQFEFPLGPNSYFLSRINEIILNTLQSGLLDYWMGKSYLDMVAAGKAIHMNISYPPLASPLYLKDLYWIWLYYIMANAVAIAVFVLEILINKKFTK